MTKKTKTTTCYCGHCSAKRDLRAAATDETLHPEERAVLLSDLRADLTRHPRCSRAK